MLPSLHRNALNRLLAIHCRSFPQYLMYARPYAPGGGREKLETIQHIVDDQQQMSERIFDLLRDAEETPYTGKFPIEFTDTHDLFIDFLIQEAIEYQRQDIGVIERCVESLKGFAAGRALAEEALGMAKGHLDTLDEVAAQPGAPVA